MIKKESLKVTNDFLMKLKELNIFQARSGMNRNEVYTYTNRLSEGDILTFSRNTIIEEYSTFASGLNLFTSGSFSSLASTLSIGSKVGRYVSLAPGLKPMGFRHPIDAICMNSAAFNFSRENIASYFNNYENKYGTLNKKRVPTPQPQQRPITIGNDVWIGANVTILGGVSIGNGAVIASNSIVTKNVSPYSIVAGIPAVHKKYRFHLDIIEQLEKIQWWNYELGDLYREEIDFSKPNKFIDKFEIIKNNIRELSVNNFYPYLYRFNDINKLENPIIDNHHNILYFDIKNKSIIKSKIYLKNSLQITIKENNKQFYLFVEDYGFIDIRPNSGCNLEFSPDNLSYKIKFMNEIDFSLQINNLYLSSSLNSKFSWQPHLKEWECFSFFTKT